MQTVAVGQIQAAVGPKERADFFSAVPENCPDCGGKLKDYNAETAVVRTGVNPIPALIAHLFICHSCGLKLFAPPQAGS